MDDDKRDRAARWAQWQREHDAAVDALRNAEQACRGVGAGGAFLSANEDPVPADVQRDTLARLEEARRRLDEVRQARPGSHEPS